MFAIVRTHLVVKLAVLMLITVAAGFLAATTIAVRSQTHAMERIHRDTAGLFARSLAAGVRSSMLTGDPLTTRQLLTAAKQDSTGITVRVFAPNGEEVWTERGPVPRPEALAPALRLALSSGQPQRSAEGGALVPMAHEERCTPCHDPPTRLRGVLELSTANAPRAALDEAASRAVVTSAVQAGFLQIMTARRIRQLDQYFSELHERSPGVQQVAVFDNEGETSFGSEAVATAFPALTHEAIAAAVRSNTPQTLRAGGSVAHLVPLENEARCHGCHSARDRMRGAIVVVSPERAPALEATLSEVSELSVRHIMLSGLGRLTAGYLDELASTGAVGTLRLYDETGRLYHDARTHTPPPGAVALALRGPQRRVEARSDVPGRESFTFVEALGNDAQCQRCHGNDRALRGAIEIELDASSVARQRSTLRKQAALFGGATLLMIVVALYFALRTFVLRPVQRLGAVADHIGAGNLDVEAVVSSQDEIGRLATRINEMAHGLRQRLQLAKFVSQSTVAAVESKSKTGGAGVGLGGERKHTVVLFSDVRGFTAYSEKREPEEVVAMLNAYLHVQTEVVHKHGGDVDKFVGDELMALFFGDDAELRAAKCGVEMVEAVDAMNRERGIEEIAIGVGVNAGPAIVGAMGAEARMDFTAIGDTVNLGARLCSNAGRGQVLVTRVVQEHLTEGSGFTAEALEPIKVKGKEQAIPVFAVKRVG